MRIDKLTTTFQEALGEAQTLALGKDHAYIEPAHVLAAMLRQQDGPKALLQRAGVNVAALTKVADEAVAKARAAGVELIAFPDQAEFDSRVPDMIQAWQDKQVADGMDPAVAAAVANAVRAERKE